MGAGAGRRHRRGAPRPAAGNGGFRRAASRICTPQSGRNPVPVGPAGRGPGGSRGRVPGPWRRGGRAQQHGHPAQAVARGDVPRGPRCVAVRSAAPAARRTIVKDPPLARLPPSPAQASSPSPPCPGPPGVHPATPSARGAGGRGVADRRLVSLGARLAYGYRVSHNGHRLIVETEDDSSGGHFLHLLRRRPPPAAWVRAMHTSLILYAEHEFNASTFTSRVIAVTGADMYSAITGAIGALRGPKHGGATGELRGRVLRRERGGRRSPRGPGRSRRRCW